MKRSVLAPSRAYPAWLRRVGYLAVEMALLLAYRTGRLVAWQRSLHGAGRQLWRPQRPGRRYQLRPTA
ncbi:hypothetical protein LJ737_04600 [Hymenobacter sp. 15J16-1T3B]|uniref:hypothetical protein n=1 Tax=Hymenobacter sp. 15J16-1T3B TaxID=2886941 RepID=UPI001D12ADD9|nr:hypothetical protein [Hymenobacter sp. 15J16-1T3B]MCC3156504.1 hypothetical protein [Hymenobacter sp. 15J16-1T3B]